MFIFLTIIFCILAVFYFVKARCCKFLLKLELKKHCSTMESLDRKTKHNQKLYRDYAELKYGLKSDAILDAEIIG